MRSVTTARTVATNTIFDQITVAQAVARTTLTRPGVEAVRRQLVGVAGVVKSALN